MSPDYNQRPFHSYVEWEKLPPAIKTSGFHHHKQAAYDFYVTLSCVLRDNMMFVIGSTSIVFSHGYFNDNSARLFLVYGF